MRFSDLAALVKAAAPSSGALLDQELRGVAGITEARATDVVFAQDAESLEQAMTSDAGAILASASLRTDTNQEERIVWVRDARLSFARVAQQLQPPRTVSEVHPSATIAPGATLGERVRLGPGVVIEAEVTLGDDCELDARVTVYAGTTLGRRVKVKAGAVLGSPGFGFARDATTGEYVPFPQQGRLLIGDDVAIGANTTIDRGALGVTEIGSGTKLDNLVHIAHNCVIGRNVVIAAQTGIAGSSVVEDGAVLGGQVGIGDHATIGEGVILGSKAGVLPHKVLRGPGQLFWGIPARPVQLYLRDLARLRRSK